MIGSILLEIEPDSIAPNADIHIYSATSMARYCIVLSSRVLMCSTGYHDGVRR